MKDILQDLVSKTHGLGFLELVKVNGEDDATKFESMAEDRSVILSAETHTSVAEFNSVFGMPNLDKLSLHLKNPEYEKNAKIEVISEDRNGETTPTYMHFENEAGDFQNDYRFMSKEQIENILKTAKFKGAKWNTVFEPSHIAIQRMKLMSASHSDEPIFSVKTETNGDSTDLIFVFGEPSMHGGRFVFQNDVEQSLAHTLSWPVKQALAIMSLNGKITMSISDQGVMLLSVDSGLVKYDYYLPAQSK